MKQNVPPLALIRQNDPTPPRAPASPREIDAATLAKAQAGDNNACRALVEMYQARVFAVVGRTLGSSSSVSSVSSRVEDVCQETFLRVFAHVKRFDPHGPARLSTWILTIATRLCFDELRRDRRRPVDELKDDVAAPNVTEPVALERALRRRVERAVASLPPDLRATFALRVTAELSVEETARVLGVDEGTVKSRLSRARDRLRAEIGEV